MPLHGKGEGGEAWLSSSLFPRSLTASTPFSLLLSGATVFPRPAMQAFSAVVCKSHLAFLSFAFLFRRDPWLTFSSSSFLSPPVMAGSYPMPYLPSIIMYPELIRISLSPTGVSILSYITSRRSLSPNPFSSTSWRAYSWPRLACLMVFITR